MIGVSSNPTSGMAIVTLLGVGLIFKALGWTDLTGKITALTIGTIVCIAASIAGDISQDLKTGFILGATPRKQQISELLGAVGSAFSILIMLFKIPPLPFAVGIYLPLNTMTPVFIGGLIRHMVDSRAKARDDAEGKISDSGVLLSSGFIAGEGLLGVVIAIIAVIMTQQPGEMTEEIRLSECRTRDDARCCTSSFDYCPPQRYW